MKYLGIHKLIWFILVLLSVIYDLCFVFITALINFLWDFRFRFNYAISGIVALMHDALITIIFFGVFKLQIDSVFIAAILTIIGYSINDTIVVFDRVRENIHGRARVSKEELAERLDHKPFMSPIPKEVKPKAIGM